MTNANLKQAAEHFYEKIAQNKYAEATLRNYRQKIHALLHFCDSNGLESFGYEEVGIYSQCLNERVAQGKIKDKYAGFLRSLAFAFADFNSIPSNAQDDYAFVPHKTFISSKNTLNADPITTVKHYAAADTEMKRRLMERASKEMLPDFNDTEAVWKNDKDIIGRLYLGRK